MTHQATPPAARANARTRVTIRSPRVVRVPGMQRLLLLVSLRQSADRRRSGADEVVLFKVGPSTGWVFPSIRTFSESRLDRTAAACPAPVLSPRRVSVTQGALRPHPRVRTRRCPSAPSAGVMSRREVAVLRGGGPLRADRGATARGHRREPLRNRGERSTEGASA